MANEKHTPGPWEVDGFADCQLITKDVPPAIGQPIAIGRAYGGNQIANARLIAAAPDLLDLLKRVAEADSNNDDTRSAWWEARDAAIAKAEGRS